MDLDEYASLPEALDQSVIEKKLEFILSSRSETSRLTALDCIWELALRQSNNFALLSKELSSKLSDYLIKAWEKESIDSTEICISISITLGPQPVYDEIVKVSESGKLPPDIEQAVSEAIQDVGYDVSEGVSQPQ